MSHFAKVENGIVTQVIVAEQDFINTLEDSKQWVQTSYNTYGGVHYGPDGKPDGGVALRANYAGIGSFYDAINDVFYHARPTDHKKIECKSWAVSAPNWEWTAPIQKPTDGKDYLWDETTKTWIIDTST
jgi:hypothetical protein